MKRLSMPGAMGAYDAMFWRVGIGVGIGLILCFIMKVRWPGKAALKLHVLRGSVAAAMAVSFFWGIARVPLAEAIALSFIAPLITLYLAAILLKEKIRRSAIVASILGLVGVFIILSGRLGGEAHDAEAWKGIAAIFISAVLYAYNLILQRQQAQVASPSEIVLFQSGMVMLVLGLCAPIFSWAFALKPALLVFPEARFAQDLVISACLSCFSLFLASWAYARAEAQVLVSVEYTAFIWAALMGWWEFDETVTLATVIGVVPIVAGCLIAARDGTNIENEENTSVSP